jgi:hypothetical protein
MGRRCAERLLSVCTASQAWFGSALMARGSYLHAVRAIWSGLATLIKLDGAADPSTNTCADAETEVDALILRPLAVTAGFALADPADARYQAVRAHRARFGAVLDRAARFLQARTGGEDHIDAVLATLKACDAYMLEYGTTRSTYDALRKNYGQARECVGAPPAMRGARLTRCAAQPEPGVAEAEDELADHLREARAGVPCGPHVHEHALSPAERARRSDSGGPRRVLALYVHACAEVSPFASLVHVA